MLYHVFGIGADDVARRSLLVSDRGAPELIDYLRRHGINRKRRQLQRGAGGMTWAELAGDQHLRIAGRPELRRMTYQDLLKATLQLLARQFTTRTAAQRETIERRIIRLDGVKAAIEQSQRTRGADRPPKSI